MGEVAGSVGHGALTDMSVDVEALASPDRVPVGIGALGPIWGEASSLAVVRAEAEAAMARVKAAPAAMVLTNWRSPCADPRQV